MRHLKLVYQNAVACPILFMKHFVKHGIENYLHKKSTKTHQANSKNQKLIVGYLS